MGNSKDDFKMLVIVLSSGENETEACIDSLMSQQGVSFDIFRIKDMPNKAAHEELYKKIEIESVSYDIFLKVDADMVFLSGDKISKMSEYFRANRALDHAAFAVLDWYSQKAIIGMHMFSNRCRWPRLSDPLFVDPTPVFPGKSELVWELPSPVAYHSPNPSTAQAIQFGYHRALKIIQRNRSAINIERSIFHYDLMKQVYAQAKISPDCRRSAALFGAEIAFSTKNEIFPDRRDAQVEKLIDEYDALSNREVDRIVGKRWGGGRLSFRSWFDTVFLKVWLRYFVSRIRRKILIPLCSWLKGGR